MPQIQRLCPLAPASFPGMLYAAAHTAHAFVFHRKSVAVAELHAKGVVFQLKVQKGSVMPSVCCGI